MFIFLCDGPFVFLESFVAMEGGDNASSCAGNLSGTLFDGDSSESDDGSDDNMEVSHSAVSNIVNTANLQFCLHGAMELGQEKGNRSGHGAEGGRAGRGRGGCDRGGCG